MRESLIEKKVTKHAQSLGWLAYKFSSPSNRAVPDHLYIKNGITVYIEYKAPGKLPTKLQLEIHNKFKSHGVEVYVIDDVEQGGALFNAIK